MKITTRDPAMMLAQVPLSIESWPRDGPTVRSSRMLTGAGRAPARSTMARSVGLFHGEGAGDLGLAAGDPLLDDRGRMDDAVQDDRQPFLDVFAGDPVEDLRALRVEFRETSARRNGR